MKLIGCAIGVIMILGMGVTAGAQESSSDTLDSQWVCPQGYEGETLYIWNWANYIAPNTVSNFEKLCDVTVVYDTYSDDQEMLMAIRRGGTPYSLVFPGNGTVSTMISEHLLHKLNHENIPNLVNLMKRFRNTPQDPDNQYTVPYQWGTIGVGYNKARVGHDITSWNDVFTYDGTVGWLDMPQVVLDITMNYLGGDVTSASVRDIENARDFLLKIPNPNISIVSDPVAQELLTQGQLDIVIDWSGSIARLGITCGCDDFVYTIPTEGTVFWFDAMVIPLDAPQAELAEVFIDYILDPVVSAEISNTTAYTSPNRISRDQKYIDPNLLHDAGLYPPQDVIDKLFYLTNVSPNMARIYQNSWDEIHILLTQD